MLKNILKLNGAQQLSKNEQKSINGGLAHCPPPGGVCGPGYCCSAPNNNGACIKIGGGQGLCYPYAEVSEI